MILCYQFYTRKILGVFLDGDLSFKTHIFTLVKKSRQMRNLLLNTFHGLNNKIVISFYKVYVTSLLDYASLIHSPYFKYLIDLLENVKRNFTKRLPGLCILNYIDYLRICNLESLELRRIRSDMCFVDKLLHGLFEFNLSEFITVSSNIHNARGNCLKLKTHMLIW